MDCLISIVYVVLLSFYGKIAKIYLDTVLWLLLINCVYTIQNTGILIKKV
jgi:hypothetical protein